MDPHEKVPIDTMIMIATRAAIGMAETHSPRPTHMTRRNTPAAREDNRPPPPPDLMLMIDCPIIAHPAMPPRNPVATFATP